MAALSIVVAAAVTVLAALPGNGQVLPISLIMGAYYACVCVMLVTAFFRQLQYDPYSYNVIYYLGFFLFAFSLLAYLVLSVTRVLSVPAEPNIKYILTAMTDSAGNFLSLIAVYIIPFSVVLGHLGNESGSSPWMYSDVISHCSGIDAWIDGHSHDSEQVVMKDRDGKAVILVGMIVLNLVLVVLAYTA